MKLTLVAKTCLLFSIIIAICVPSSARESQAAGYLEQVNYKPQDAEYFDLVNKVVQLTPEEMGLLQKNGFVVTERLSYMDFIQAYAWIYNKDMPVMITTDSMLEAIHQTQSDLLMRTETSIITPILKDMLTRTLDVLHAAKDKVPQTTYNDLDTFLNVDLSLLLGKESSGNPDVTRYLGLALSANSVETINLFGGKPRDIDFTLFQPTGHYLKTPELQNYYRALRWLGQIDFRLVDYDGYGTPILNRDHIAAAVVLRNLMSDTNIRPEWQRIETLLSSLFGYSDNITLPKLEQFLSDAKLSTPQDALNANPDDLLKLLTSNDYGKQKIGGQIIATAADNPSTQPFPISFLVFGPRFTIDSYVMSQLVFDRLLVNGNKVGRAYPSPLDVMGALGSDRAVTLDSDVRQFGYQKNLDDLRGAVNQVDKNTWAESSYNLWLSALRTLNATTNANNYPQAMQTSAWADKTLQTQLASWAQLRHDTELYVKQTNTGNIMCQYPAGFVEPYPEFYQALYDYADAGRSLYQSVLLLDGDALRLQQTAVSYFEHLMRVSQQLKSMAEKELRGEPFNSGDELFLKDIVVLQEQHTMCGLNSQQWDGWYAALYPWYAERNLADPNDYNPLVLAGIHTNTNDQLQPQGVLYAGTGPVATHLFIADAKNSLAIYVSPVFTYYQFIEAGNPPPRLSDLDWMDRLQSAQRPTPPDWTASFRVPSATFPDYQVPGRQSP